MIHKILIIGAGGWGREVLAQMQDDPANGKDWTIKGFLDSRPGLLGDTGCDTPILGNPLDYVPAPEDAFVCAIGAPAARHDYSQPLLTRGAEFIPLLTGAFLNPRIRIGKGCILCSRVQISPDVWIGDFANIHTMTVVGHDAHIGDYAQIGAMVFIGGGTCIGARAVVNPHATILPGIQIGEGATVGAGAVVVKDVPAGSTVFGNPAKVIFHSILPEN
ncbi:MULTISPECIES: acetyltransferase [Delftia]|nr:MULTISPECIES: acetyltransferase [Delftia]KAA9178139.1 acetyltransferase [Delftia sp. BR1]EPD36179.1 hypothetical protein HMPREF9702_05614 [Delftia acidovorans CCUG 15835]MDH0418859.1 acetyltransferase [Delftia tsuruhatensis]QFS63391.1 acetyltransferase [Delftia tsuruhatensis]WON90714.1 acetyltransferase [Delftia sp. UGAL515B_04]